MNKRSANFSSNEVKVLLELVDKYIKPKEADKTDKLSWKDKAKAWKDVERLYNMKYVERFRSAKVLKTKYDNLKKTAKRNYRKIKRETDGNDTNAFDSNAANGEHKIIDVGSKTDKFSNWPSIESFENDSIEIIDTNNLSVANSFVDSDSIVSDFDNDEEDKIIAALCKNQNESSSNVWNNVVKEKMKRCKLQIKSEKEEFLLKKSKLLLEMRCIEEQHALKLKKLNLEIETLMYKNEMLKKRFQ